MSVSRCKTIKSSTWTTFHSHLFVLNISFLFIHFHRHYFCSCCFGIESEDFAAKPMSSRNSNGTYLICISQVVKQNKKTETEWKKHPIQNIYSITSYTFLFYIIRFIIINFCRNSMYEALNWIARKTNETKSKNLKKSLSVSYWRWA